METVTGTETETERETERTESRYRREVGERADRAILLYRVSWLIPCEPGCLAASACLRAGTVRCPNPIMYLILSYPARGGTEYNTRSVVLSLSISESLHVAIRAIIRGSGIMRHSIVISTSFRPLEPQGDDTG